MKRRLWNVLVAASLVLCMTVAVVWIRSYWRSDAIVYSSRNGHRGMQWAKGVVLFERDNVGVPNGGFGFDSWDAKGLDVRLGSGVWSQLGFGHDRAVTLTETVAPEVLASFSSPPPATIIAERLSLPLWPLFVFFLVLPAPTGITMLRRWQRRRANRCPTCGYDLRATPERCPECGAARLRGWWDESLSHSIGLDFDP